MEFPLIQKVRGRSDGVQLKYEEFELRRSSKLRSIEVKSRINPMSLKDLKTASAGPKGVDSPS